jgi:hypothetical protein
MASPPPSAVFDPSADTVSVQDIEVGATELHPLIDLYDADGRPFVAPAATWTMINDGVLDVTHPVPGCLSHAPHYTAAYDREFSYGLQANGLEKGHGAVAVYAAEWAIDISNAQEEVSTGAYLECYEAKNIRGYLTQHPGVTLNGPTTRKVETIDVGVPNLTILFVTPFGYQKSDKVDYTVVSWLAYDRYRVISWVQTCCGEPNMTDVQPDFLLIAQRIQAAARR